MNPFDKYNNQADVIDIDKWLAQQQALQKANKSKSTQKPKDKGSFLTHLLPTIGGTGGGVAGGAAGGALAGTAIFPGVGTAIGGLAGALLGGAAGGAAGKVAENKIEGNSLGSGVLGQAAEQGVLSAGPVRLLKGAGAAVKAGGVAAKGGGSLADALTAAGQSQTAPTFGKLSKNLVTQGQAAQGRVAGVSAGTKIAGKELTPQDTKKMLDTLKSEGINSGNANNSLRDVQDKLSQYGKQIGDHFTTSNTPLAKKDVRTIASDYIKGLNTSDPVINKQAKILATDLKNSVTDTKSLWKFRKSLDSRIPDAKQGTDNVTTAKITALKNLRQHVTKQLGDVPGAKNYHALSEVKPFISAEAKRLNNPGGGIVGRIASSGPVQKAESVLGKATESAGNVLDGPASPYGLKSVASRTLPIGAAQAGLGQMNSDMQNQSNSPDPMNTSMSNSNMDPLSQTSGDLSSALMGAQQGTGNPYTRENLLADIKRDPKNIDKYISTYESLDKVFSPAAGSKLNSTQLQQANNANSGISALNEIAQTLQSNPNASKLASLPGGGIASNLTGTGSYKAAISNATDVIGRLRSGGAIQADEEKRFLSLLPGAFDDQQTVQYKLQSLYSLFDSFANPQQGGGADTTDLTSALMQYQ